MVTTHEAPAGRSDASMEALRMAERRCQRKCDPAMLLAYGLLCVGLWNALGLPELDLRHPGAGCLVETVIIEREAA